jgi:hypothetical protein
MKSHLTVLRQVPEFIRAEYPAFIEFLKAYYTWLEDEYFLGQYEDLFDIDDTIDEFLTYFRQQLDIYGITSNDTDKIYIRNIKQLYQSKGSSDSIEFLLKILFNKPSQIVHPWDFTFKPSVGEWKQEVSLIVDITRGTLNDFTGTSLIINDNTGHQYRTHVIDATPRKDGFVELFVNRFFSYGELISVVTTDNIAAGNVKTTTVKAIIENGGHGFSVGQIFAINSNSGSGTLIKIKAVDVNGAIKAVDIIKAGTGYTVDFNLFMSATSVISANQVGSYIQLNALAYQTDDYINAQNESGQFVKHDYTNLNSSYMTDPSYVGDVVGEIKSVPGTVYTEQYANIKFIVGQLFIYPGYYISSNNLLDDVAYIEDSRYYQAFSYVTVIDEALSKYSTLLRKLVHPTGTKHFGQYDINNTLSLDVQAYPSLNIISKADAIRDYVEMLDEIRFAVSIMIDTHNVVIDDVFSRIVQYMRSFGHTVTVTEDLTRAVSKAMPGDTVVIGDTGLTIVPGINMGHGVTITENATLTFDKYLNTDSVSVSSSGIIYAEPYFVLPVYWEAGYLQNERIIS